MAIGVMGFVQSGFGFTRSKASAGFRIGTLARETTTRQSKKRKNSLIFMGLLISGHTGDERTVAGSLTWLTAIIDDSIRQEGVGACCVGDKNISLGDLWGIQGQEIVDLQPLMRAETNIINGANLGARHAVIDVDFEAVGPLAVEFPRIHEREIRPGFCVLLQPV